MTPQHIESYLEELVPRALAPGNRSRIGKAAGQGM